jgi:hypothetical protein
MTLLALMLWRDKVCAVKVHDSRRGLEQEIEKEAVVNRHGRPSK